MLISAAGKTTNLAAQDRSRLHGFTLIELLVVLAIIAIATAGATVALRDNGATSLEREAQRVAAILEAGRSQSRSTGLPVRWQPSAQGFILTSSGIADSKQEQAWLTPGITAQTDDKSSFVLLGPEPIIAAQTITLRLDGRSLQISTDGLRPFRVNDGAI